MKKKQVPITIINQVHAALKDASHLIGVNYKDDCVILLKEKNDPDSPFFFKVENIELRTENRTVYSISYLPSNNDNLSPLKIGIISSDLTKHLETWVAMVVKFNKKSSIFDDEILESYYNEIEAKFTVNDDDADVAPYPHETQKQLYSLYEEIKRLVESDKSPEDSEEAEVIIKEIESAQRKIGKQTKREATKNLQMILAMLKKYSYIIAEKVIDGIIGAAIGNLLTGG